MNVNFPSMPSDHKCKFIFEDLYHCSPVDKKRTGGRCAPPPTLFMNGIIYIITILMKMIVKCPKLYIFFSYFPATI